MPNVPNVPGVPALSSYSDDTVVLATSDAALVVAAFLPPAWGIYYHGAPVLIPASVASAVLSSALAPAVQVASLLGVQGLPVVASTVDFDFHQDWAVADYPVEQGGFQSYDRVTMPFDIRMRVACGGAASQRQSFINTLLGICGAPPLGATVSPISQALGSIGSSLGISSSLSLVGSSSTAGAGPLPTYDIVTPEGTFTSCSPTHLGFTRKADAGASLVVADIWFVQVRITSTSTFQNTQSPTVAGQQSLGVVSPTAPAISSLPAIN